MRLLFPRRLLLPSSSMWSMRQIVLWILRLLLLLLLLPSLRCSKWHQQRLLRSLLHSSSISSSQS